MANKTKQFTAFCVLNMLEDTVEIEKKIVK